MSVASFSLTSCCRSGNKDDDDEGDDDDDDDGYVDDFASCCCFLGRHRVFAVSIDIESDADTLKDRSVKDEEAEEE